MKVIKKRKYFIDFEKEENWLNDLAKQGLRLVNVKWGGRYYFEKCEPDKYTYRLEFINKNIKDEDNYIDLLKESGIRIVKRYFSWLFLEKESSEGEFELYTDAHSKLKQYTMMRNVFCLPCIFFIMMVPTMFNSAKNADTLFGQIFFGITAVLGSLALILLGSMGLRMQSRISQIKKDNFIDEDNEK